MRIGKVAKETGLSIDAIRYYEKRGLIPEPSRHPNGYREYPAATVSTLQEIRSLSERTAQQFDLRFRRSYA